jgi:TonB family protein
MQESLRYPASAKEDAVYGTVYASFVVRRDGRITDAEVLRGVREDLDREVLRVLSGMPSWEPARNEGGEAVSMRFNLPVRFSLLDEAPVAGLAPSREGITLVMVGEERFEWPEGRATRLEDLVPSGEIESVTVLQGEEALLEFGYESVILIERKSEPRQ